MFKELAEAIRLEVGRARTGLIPSYYLSVVRKAEQARPTCMRFGKSCSPAQADTCVLCP